MTCHFPCDLTLMAFFLSLAIWYSSISDLTWITYVAIPLRIPAVKRNDHWIISYVFDSARIPNSFFVDCFSFEANCLWKRHCVSGGGTVHSIETGLRSTKPNNLFNDSAFRRQDTKWCPVSFSNLSASLRICRLKHEFLMNYTLCPCWSHNAAGGGRRRVCGW